MYPIELRTLDVTGKVDCVNQRFPKRSNAIE